MSGKDQISITVDDGVDVIHVSIALQIRIMRWWFFCFGFAYYQQRFVVVWLTTVGSVNVNVIPVQLAMLMTPEKKKNRSILHIAFASRLHRNANLFLVISRYFRIQMHLGTHNVPCPATSGWPAVADLADQAVLPRDLSHCTDFEILQILCNNSLRWEIGWAGQCRAARSPDPVTDKQLLDRHVSSMDVRAVPIFMMIELPNGALDNSGHAGCMLSHLPRPFDTQGPGITRPGEHEVEVDQRLPRDSGGGDHVGGLSDPSVFRYGDQAHSEIIGKLKYVGPCYKFGCSKCCDFEEYKPHQSLCRFLPRNAFSYRCREIVDFESARDNVIRVIFPLLMVAESNTQMSSYFSGYFSRLPFFQTGLYDFGPQLGGFQKCGYPPKHFEYIDEPGPNFFRDLRVENCPPIPIHEVFQSVWYGDDVEKNACFDQLAWTLLHRVQSLARFHFYNADI